MAGDQPSYADISDADVWREWDPDDGCLYECPACCALVRWWSIEDHKRWHRRSDGNGES